MTLKTLTWNSFQCFCFHIEKTKTKENAEIFVNYLCESINAMFISLMSFIFLKLAGVTRIHNLGRKELKEDYRSVSILPTMLSQNINADFGKVVVLNIAI